MLLFSLKINSFKEAFDPPLYSVSVTDNVAFNYAKKGCNLMVLLTPFASLMNYAQKQLPKLFKKTTFCLIIMPFFCFNS